MKKINIKFFSFLIVFCVLSLFLPTDHVLAATKTATITNSSATTVTTTTATLNGKIIATGGENPTVTVYWGTADGAKTPGKWQNSSAPTSPSQPQGAAAFSKNITGLNPGTKYYFTAKVTNSAGTSWPSKSLSFITAVALPTITLSPANSITKTTATLNGNVTSNGGANASVTVYWGTKDKGHTATGWDKSSALASQGVAAFLKNITGLALGTKYYFTAKATNSAGTSWPVASLSFTTLAAPTIVVSVTTSVARTTATLNGRIASTGGENPTVTVYWGTADGAKTPGKWQNSSAPTSPSQPQGAAAFSKNITGLAPGTKYYFTAKATNSAGTSWPVASLSFTTPTLAAPTITISAATSVISATAILNGDVTATGGSNPTVTIYWGTTDGGQISGNWQNNSAPTSPAQPQGAAAFSKNLMNLNPGTKYYFTAKATNSAGDAWPVASLSFTTLSVATVTISAAINVALSSATLNGNVSATLNGDLIETGGDNPTVTIYWGTTDGGQTPSNWQNSSAPTSPSQPQGAAAFYKDVTNLSPGTKYYFLAKATNVAGDAWPVDSLNFTTPALAASAITISAATSVTSTTATLNGNVTTIGEDNPTVTVYWGTTDGGQTPSNWQNSSAPTSPSQPQGAAAFSKNLTDLTLGIKYYFTAKATNSAGTSWPAASLSFTPISAASLIATYTLTITPNNGTAVGSSFSSVYSAGSVVTFTAIPTVGYMFDHWSGDMTGDANPITIAMDGNKSVIANFKPVFPVSIIDISNAAAALLSKSIDFIKQLFIFNF